MNIDPLLSVLQFSDGLFPSGGYAHSFGLEYYVQTGAIGDAGDVQAYIEAYLEGSAGPCDAVAAASTMVLAQAGDLAACLSLDQILHAMKPVSEFRDASRQMGRQMLRVISAVTDHPIVTGFCESVENETTSGHQPVVFGLAGNAFGWACQEAALAHLYSTASLIVHAALRLLPLGQVAGQRILWAVSPLITRLAREVEGKGIGDLWSFAPGIEIAGMRHARLDARLFRS